MTITRREFLQSSGLAAAAVVCNTYRPLPSLTVPYRPVVVYLFLRGGLDGLSVVVPHDELRYYRERPHIAVPAREVLKLNSYFGLHPSLVSLIPFWKAGTLTVIPAAGLPQASHSHLDAQGSVSRLISGAAPCRSLTRAAQLIHAGVAPAGMRIDIGGWDTHFNQGSVTGRLASLLGELGCGIAGFAHSLGSRMRNVTLVTISEFGRTIRENSNGGTDHGHATAMLVIGASPDGGRVVGGEHRFEQRGLAVTTDLQDCVTLASRGLHGGHA